MIRGILLVCVLVFVSQVYSAGSPCKSDSDCAGGCCYNHAVHGQTCYQYQNVSQPCHLPNHNHAVMLYPCGCMQGLTCDEIHFDPAFSDPVHQAENLLLGRGYGYCTDTPGVVFGK